MRKPLIATATACLLAFGLPGCGDKSNDVQVGEQLDVLLDKMRRLDAARTAPDENNKLVYTYGTTVGNVEVPGSASDEAAYIDQATSLIPLAEKIAGEGNDHQKQTANAIIASILADESAYLISVAQHAYQKGTLEVSGLRPRVRTLQDIIELNSQIGGDRSASIAVIRTGKISESVDVEGLTEMQAKSDAAMQAAQQARAKLAEINAKIKQLRDEVARYESLELTLSNEALGSQGEIHFDKLDKATTAAYEAELAESNAEVLQIDAYIYTGQADLAESTQNRSAQVVDTLEDQIDQIEQEKRTVASALDALKAERAAMVKTMTADFAEFDAEIKARGFDRMKLAQDKLFKADQALAAANLGTSGQLEQLSVYLLRARVLQQQSLSARSYAATLQSLAAAGPEAIGSGLHGALTARIKDMEELQASVASDAKKLDEAARDTVQTIKANADTQSPDGQAVSGQVDLYQSLISGIDAE